VAAILAVVAATSVAEARISAAEARVSVVRMFAASVALALGCHAVVSRTSMARIFAPLASVERMFVPLTSVALAR
jgi:hypothetical protein